MLDLIADRPVFKCPRTKKTKMLRGLYCGPLLCRVDDSLHPVVQLRAEPERNFILLSCRAAFAGLDASFTSCYSSPYMSEKTLTFVATENL